MPTTVRTDLILKDILVPAIQAEFAGMRVLLGSRAVIYNTSLPVNTIQGGRIQGGTRIQMPYFNSMGKLDDVANEGDALIPVKLTMTDEFADVQHSGKAFEITEWAQFAAAYADPYAEAARQFRVMVQNRFEDKIVQTAGVGLPAGFVHDVWSAVNPILLNWDVMVDAKLKWGDEQGNIELISVHSKVYGDLLKLKDSTGRPLLTDPNNADLMKFNGVPIKVSDRNTVVDPGGGSPKKYESLIFKTDAVALWTQGAPTVKEDEDILADTNLTAIHVYYVCHRYLRTPGYSKPGVVKIVTN